MKGYSFFRWLIFVLFAVSFVTRTAAQEANTIPIRFAGRVQNVAGSTMLIDQISVDMSSASITTTISNGAMVVVEGNLRVDGTVIARTVSAYMPPSTPSPPSPLQPSPPKGTPQPVAQPPTNFTVTGQIEAINGASITVNGQQIHIGPAVPGLPPLHVGDQVIVVGLQFPDHIDAVTITRISATPASVTIEGVVQKIDKTVITVNDQPIQIAPHDPMPGSLKLGDSVRIEGQYQQTPHGLVFQATQITIVASTQNANQGNEDNNTNAQGMGKGMGG